MKTRHAGRRTLLRTIPLVLLAAAAAACGGGDPTGPADTTAPTASVVAPPGELAGTVTLRATAADDHGIAGVRFYLDGQPLGDEDTAAPFELAWNTTTATNGAHTLTAVARDAAGNTATSAPVSVTVHNAGAPQAGALTVSATTTGGAPDADGYQVIVDGAAAGALGAGGTLALQGLAAGTHAVALGGLAPNCHVVGENPRQQTIVAGTPATLAFEVACPIGGGEGQLVFEGLRDGSGHYDLYLVAIGGTGQTQLTTDANDDIWPAWSPDGRKIAFARAEAGNSENSDLWVMNADGTGAVRLTTSAAQEEQPAWSPDGTKIAYLSKAAGSKDVWLMNADGSSPTRVTTTDDLDEDGPHWAPDGQHLVFARWDSDNSASTLYLARPDGSGEVKLTAAMVRAAEPAWSPDGTRIAFSGWTADDNLSHIYAIRPDGTGLTQLTSGNVEQYSPAWSPDGSRISYSGQRAGSGYGLFVMAADGSDAHEVSSGLEFTGVSAWRPVAR